MTILLFVTLTVTPTIEEPFPGWLDNFNGPTGIVVAGGTGIHRFINATKDNNLDYQVGGRWFNG